MYKKAIKILLTGVGLFALLVGSMVVWVYFNQEKIIEKTKNAVESSINGELAIGSFQFKPFGRHPGLTFSFTNIQLKDSLFSLHQKPLGQISKLDVTFGLETLFLMNIRVKDVRLSDTNVFVFVRRDGYSNRSIFSRHSPDGSPKPSDVGNIFGKIKGIRLHNVRLTYADSLKEKFYDATLKRVSGNYSSTSDGWSTKLQGPVAVEKLVFNNDKGAFLKAKDIQLAAFLKYHSKEQDLEVLPESYIQLESHERINISGHLVGKAPEGTMNLRFQTSRIRVPVATRLLADTLAMKIDRVGIDTYTSADVHVNGNLGIPNPWVTVDFKTDTFTYATPVGYFRGMKTTGYFTNRIDTLRNPSPANSEIKTGRITGFFEKVPLKGTLKLNDLSDPTASILLHVETDSSGLNSLLDNNKYQVSSGSVHLDLYFNGKLKTLYNDQTDELDGQLRGKAIIKDLAVSYLPQNIKLSRIESNVSVNHDVILIDKLNVYDNLNQLYITGKLSRYLHHLLGSPKPAKASIDIEIPKWKLNWIEVLVNNGQKNNKKDPDKKFSRLIDQLIENMEVDANLQAGQLSYYNFNAQNVKGSLSMANNVTRIKSLQLDAFGGHATLSGRLHSPKSQSSFSSVDASGKIVNADVSDILHSFNSFGQKSLAPKNVKGQLNLNFRFSSKIKPDVSLVPQSMNGYLDMDLTNGQLINFEPLLKVKKIIFKKRPLEHVKIAPIRRRFDLHRQEIRIPKMQIESNVVTLFLEGQYSFGDKTDLSIQFPLKNLKKREEDYQFQTYDSDELRSIFLRAVDENGEVNIKLDSRKKAKKRSDDSSKSPDS